MGLAVVEALEHLALHRAARQRVDLIVDLVDRLDGVALEIGPAVVAIDDDEFGVESGGVARVAGFDHATKRGRDGHPTLRIDLMRAFTYERAAHCPRPSLLTSPPNVLSSNEKTAG